MAKAINQNTIQENKENTFYAIAQRPVNVDAIQVLKHETLGDKYDFIIDIPINELFTTYNKVLKDFKAFIAYYIPTILNMRGMSSSFPQSHELDVRAYVTFKDIEDVNRFVDPKKEEENESYRTNILKMMLSAFNGTLINSTSQVKQCGLMLFVGEENFIRLRFTAL